MNKNLWRVAPAYGYDDVHQEAQLVFYELRSRYCPIDTPEHFMALFKTAWTRRFTDMSNAMTRWRAEIPDSATALITEEGETDTAIARAVGDSDTHAEVEELIRKAPQEVREVLALFVNAPTELLELIAESWFGRGKKKSMGASHVAALLGRSGDALQPVRRYFEEGRV